jgi:dimethylaniline monooxygenase (N-oxide forming)
MPPPSEMMSPDARLGGKDLNLYMESFADRFLKGKFRFNVEILNVSRNMNQSTGGWIVSIEDKVNGRKEELYFDKIVVCTGVRHHIYS